MRYCILILCEVNLVLIDFKYFFCFVYIMIRSALLVKVQEVIWLGTNIVITIYSATCVPKVG